MATTGQLYNVAHATSTGSTYANITITGTHTITTSYFSPPKKKRKYKIPEFVYVLFMHNDVITEDTSDKKHRFIRVFSGAINASRYLEYMLTQGNAADTMRKIRWTDMLTLAQGTFGVDMIRHMCWVPKERQWRINREIDV